MVCFLVALCSLSAASPANAVLARHSHHQCLLLRESSQLSPELNPAKMPLKKGVVDLYRAKRKRAAKLATVEVTTQSSAQLLPLSTRSDQMSVSRWKAMIRMEVRCAPGGHTRRTLDEAVHGGRVIYVPCHRSPTKTCGQVSRAMGIMAASQRVEILDLQRTLGGGDRAGLLVRGVRVVGRTPPPGRDPGSTCVSLATTTQGWHPNELDATPRPDLEERLDESVDLSMVCVRCHGATAVA